ncbi:hypothetical protein [Thalassotalea ganghwensis]
MTISEEILCIANQLANQGKKPTVALIKPKLSQPVPLPSIVSALKTWTHQPERTAISPLNKLANISASNNNNDMTQDINDAIERALQPLKAQITALEKEVTELKQKLNEK